MRPSLIKRAIGAGGTRNPDGQTAPWYYVAQRGQYNRGNVAIGFGLGIFCFSVYTYSMWAIKQEDFSDVDERAEFEQRQREEEILKQYQLQRAQKQ
eukprot:CFRG4215T1